jgi:serine protease Do
LRASTQIYTIRDLLPQLRNGKVVRGVIGVNVRIDPLSDEIANGLGLPNSNGALLTQVAPGQPAARAGLQGGDVIVEFNGQPVTDSDALVGMVVGTRPGTSVPVTIYRDKKRQNLNVTVDELDLEAEQGQLAQQNAPAEPESTGIGMDIAPLTAEMARALELPRSEGAVVTRVERNGPAATAGVIPNDVILEVNRQPVSSVAQVTRALQAVQAGEPVFLLVQRGANQVFIPIMKR